MSSITAGIARILASGAGYARQRGVFARSGSLHSVADLLVQELESDLPLGNASALAERGATN